MTTYNISRYLQNRILLIILLLTSSIVFSQEKSEGKDDIDNTEEPTKIPYKYGLRIGIDISGPIIMLVDENETLYKGNFDLRVYKRYFVAGEFGYESREFISEDLNYSTSGSFLTVGGDYDLLGYHPGRNDLLAFGVRYGISHLKQTVNEYSIQNGYWNNDIYTGNIDTQNSLAHWASFKMELKVEVLHNFYLGSSIGVNFLVHDTELDNFDNLYIPGYGENKNNKSWVFNYTLMYLFPFN